MPHRFGTVSNIRAELRSMGLDLFASAGSIRYQLAFFPWHGSSLSDLLASPGHRPPRSTMELQSYLKKSPLQSNAVERLKSLAIFPIDRKASVLIPSHAR